MCRTIYRPIVSDGGECPRGTRGYENLHTQYLGIVTRSTGDDAPPFFRMSILKKRNTCSHAGRDPERSSKRCGLREQWGSP